MVESLPSKQVVASSSLVFRFLYIKNERKESLTRICKQTSLQHLRFTCSICYRKLPAPDILRNQRFLECRASLVFRFLFYFLCITAAWPSGKAGACKAFIPSSNLGAAFCFLFIIIWGIKHLECSNINHNIQTRYDLL